MAIPNRGEIAAEIPSAYDNDLGVELDAQTALSLARAATVALLNLSPLSHREIVAALKEELVRLRSQDDGHATTAADLVAQYLPDAA
ncbi:MAG: hypothetical protein GC203_15980 [Phenylobacterium sp.]|uniref:hypothetical protein n=1 Tax=Phenylobacterium sp. TaxID=1871053 RepID=UPI0025CBEA3C|nr:hypothetical protein [Phenylobacterium sp.]MBI1199360.1 hypothetical protein [Phenylobacterium sp.]